MGKLSKLQLRKQAEEQIKISLDQSLKINKLLYKKGDRVLAALYQNDLKYFNLASNSGWQRIGLIFQQIWREKKYEISRKVLYSFLQKLLKIKGGNDLLSDPKIINGLAAIAQNLNWAVREVEDWQPKFRNRYRRFSDLIRHLFAKYEVPKFMDQVFFEDNQTQIKWFCRIGQGENIRKMTDLPLSLTSKMAHYFMQAPDYLSITEALRYGQVMGMGGDFHLFRHLLGTRLGRSIENDSFWQTVIQWFINQPMLDPIYFGPIVDYIHHHKFVRPQIINADGGLQILPPINPDFSMKGRSPRALLREVEAWHNELNQMQKQEATRKWKGFAIDDFIFVINQGKINQKTYRLQQLLSAAELIAEGSAMNHCVATYAQTCRRGNSSIWALTLETITGMPERLLTIELSKTREIIQARGKYNARPTEEDLDILARWAMKNELSISRWL